MNEAIPVRDLRQAQLALRQIAADLERADRRLQAVAATIEPAGLLAAELRDGARSVATDLLGDAIDTLRMLGGTDEAGVARRRREIDGAARLAAAAP
ncbi:MAG: hypothetical protein D6696_05285 [Acidobacteria bacterium]|nr:MAG: hypothetical protein D6696_05285 [Acidobacteriota bacterium]